jgi:hypothetical protein
MINHSLPAFSSISTRSIGAAVAHSLARLCRLPRVRKANGIEFCRVGRPEAWRVVPFEGSNPSSAPFFSGVEGGMFAGLISPRSPVRVRPPLPFFTLPPRFGRESLCWDGQRDFFIFSPLALSH